MRVGWCLGMTSWLTPARGPQEVEGHPDLREGVVGERSVQVPVEQVSQQLQAMGIHPTTGWH